MILIIRLKRVKIVQKGY